MFTPLHRDYLRAVDATAIRIMDTPDPRKVTPYER